MYAGYSNVRQQNILPNSHKQEKESDRRKRCIVVYCECIIYLSVITRFVSIWSDFTPRFIFRIIMMTELIICARLYHIQQLYRAPTVQTFVLCWEFISELKGQCYHYRVLFFLSAPMRIWASVSLHPRGSPVKQYPSLKACLDPTQGLPKVLKYYFENRIFKVEVLWQSKTGFSFLIVWPGLLLLRQKSLEADVVRVAVDWGFVGAGLNLLWFLWCERVGSTVPDVNLQLQQYLEWALELHLAVETKPQLRKQLTKEA